MKSPVCRHFDVQSELTKLSSFWGPLYPAGMAIVAETMKNHYLVSSPFLKNQIEKEKMTSLTKLRLKPTKHDLALVKQNYYFVKFDLFVKPSGK
uniref:Uncharacterized protein n=1 Tax=Candidatus Kentrum sp. LFY TaxID=2126342 RepID=A0A450X416_9GAMM|nr:MAG: hypothetical protein BECKLFY1418C_GA0070996_11623 [Candidatus Kentron sp. LFY]